MDRLYCIFYKDHCTIQKSKEPLDNVTLFVRILINGDDEVDATYSDPESEDGNNDDLERGYDDDKEDIFDYL